MGWSNGFKAALKKPSITPAYRLRFHRLPTGPGQDFTIAGGLDPSLMGGMDPVTGAATAQDVTISREGPRVMGCSVSPISWSVNFGGFEVPIVGDISKLWPKLSRGVFASLHVIIDDIEERICFGQLKEIKGRFHSWTLVFQDFISSLQRTADGSIATSYLVADELLIDDGKFFNKAGRQANATAMTLGDNTITINACQFFEHQYNENGLAQIEMKDAGGATIGTAFFEYTAVSAASGSGTLTLSADSKAGNIIYPGTAALQSFNTGIVTSYAQIHGKPWDIFKYLVLSVDGNNTNNADQFPESFSSGGNFPLDIVDLQDFASANSYIAKDFASYALQLPIGSPWESGLRIYVDQMSKLGQWPCWRQDSVSWRFARPLYDNDFLYPTSINDKDIIEVVSHDIFSQSSPTVYAGLKITYAEAGGGGTIAFGKGVTYPKAYTLPLTRQYKIQAENMYDQDGNPLNFATSDVNRMFDWVIYPLETINLVLHLSFMKLCAGDIVEVTSNFLKSPKEGDGYFNKQRAMVTAVSYEIGQARCNVELTLYREIWKNLY